MAAERYRDNGHRYNEANALSQLGDALAEGGEAAAAEHAWRQALDILSELDHPDAAAVRSKLDSAGRRPVRAG